MPNLFQPIPARLKLAAAVSFALALAACGGGGGNPGAVGGGSGTGTGTTPPVVTPPVTPVVVDPAMSIEIVSGANTEVKTLSGGQGGIVRAKFVDSKGVPIEGAKVKFTADEALVVFDPVSGSATTGKDGIATINIRAASATSAGAVTITATGAVISGIDSGKSASAPKVISVGAAPLQVDEVVFNPALAGPLSAFSTASLAIKLSSGGGAATDTSGLTIDSPCARQGLATIVPGTLTGGVLSASYTNKGCLAGTDTITVSANNSSKTASVGVSAANIGTIQFAGTDTQGTSIVLKGAGGLGRLESALVSYRVLDQNNKGLAGVEVNFSATTATGGLTVQPAKGTTDAEGRVTTTVSSGTIPTPVRVIASATRNGVNVVGLSDTLIISTGLPIQKSMSLSVDSYNIEGWRRDGTEANVTIRLADQYGNPISNGTAVNFVTEGGAIASAVQGGCITVDGACSVKLISQNFRPTNGRVTILAYVQGIEDFTDVNGDGRYTAGEPAVSQGDPYLETDLNVTGLGDKLDPLRGDLPIPFNGATYDPIGDGKWGLNYIRSTAEITFSDSTPVLVRQVCDVGVPCRDWGQADGDASKLAGLQGGAACTAQRLTFRLHDVNNNPLPHQTRLSVVDTDKIAPGTVSPDAVGSTTRIGGTLHSVVVRPDATCQAGSFGLRIQNPRDNSSVTYTFSSAP